MSLFNKNAPKAIIKLVSVIFISCFIASCQINNNPLLEDGPLNASSVYDSALPNASGEAKNALLIKKVGALVQENNLTAAVKTLAEISDPLSAQLIAQKQLIQIEIANRKGQFAESQGLLNRIDKSILGPYDQYRLALARVGSFNQQANANMLRAYIELGQVTPKNQLQAVVNETWRVVANIPQKELKNIIVTSDEFIIQGWIELRNIYDTYRNNVQNSAIMETALDNWRMRNPHNPGATFFPTQFLTPGAMPKGISGANNSANNTFDPSATTALLLPLSGSKQTSAFSNAIKRGFEYKNQATNTNVGMSVIDELVSGQPATVVESTPIQPIAFNVYDTNQKDISAILMEAEQAGITTIIGPLLKNDVAKVESYSGPLKILALNAPETLSSLPNICYFALSPEDEAQDAAMHMYNQGKRSALLLVPYGNLGDRITAAFNEKWLQLTGSEAVVKSLHDTNDLRNMGNSRDPLSIGPILKQAQVDGIYVIAEPEKLLLVKPMIMSAASNNPQINIYASSRSNKNSLGPDFKLEMQGIQFSEIPLLANVGSPSYQAAMQAMNNDYSLVRLHAMGSDANRLSQQFNTLSTDSSFTMQGDTGLITIGTNCEIKRQLIWLEYHDGVIRQVPSSKEETQQPSA